MIKIPCEYGIVEPSFVYLKIPAYVLGLNIDKHVLLPVRPRFYALSVGCYLSFRGILDPLLKPMHGETIPVCISYASEVSEALFPPQLLCE